MAQLTFNPDTPNAWVAALKEGENTIGRSEDNDVRVEEGGVSGYHCRISLEQGLVTITDLNSTNGTHINGARITQSGWAPGQIVFLGHLPVRLETRVNAGASAPTPNGGLAPSPPSAAAVSLAGSRLRIAGHSAPSESASSSSPEAESAEAPPVAPSMISAPPGTRCRSHNKSLATWSCPKCRKYFCDLCVATRSTASGPAHTCRGCGVECLPVRVELVVEQERGFFSRLPGAFVFPFKGTGVIILIIISIILAGLSAFAGPFAIFLKAAILGYLFLYLQNIIH
ncbi:MAG TPA: FHA domain-containing protein, partial [Verrucomicrobiae bacterium]|nr:FHA domain-containing protein [Verrucomicrobiae bacterium]